MQTPRGWSLLLWLGVALLAHILVALFGVLNRWLQVEPTPPLPAMRLALLVSCLALATVGLVAGTQAAAAWALARRQPAAQRQTPAGHSLSRAAANGSCKAPPTYSTPGSDTAANAADGCIANGGDEEAGRQPALAGAAATIQPAAPAAAAVAAAAGEKLAVAARGTLGCPPEYALARQQQASFVRAGSSFAVRPGDAPPPRPELALARGLSRRVRGLSAGRPRLVRWAALAVITVSFSTAYLCQVTAPGFVDPSVVQLINMFTVVGVALVQSLLLRHRLPWVIWPAMAVMLGGAAMVIVPSIGRSQSGGIDGWRGWLGFALSVASMASTVIYFVSLQASRRLGFTSLQLQFLYLCFSIAVMLPLTLAVDGADWAPQFATWRAADWAVLAVTSSCVCIGANWCIQHATWRVGAPVLSMFYGLRLVAAIVESKLLLGATVITTGLQIAGVVVTVSAVTMYMIYTWWASRQQSGPEQAAALAAADEPAAGAPTAAEAARARVA